MGGGGIRKEGWRVWEVGREGGRAYRSVARGPLHSVLQAAEARENKTVTERDERIGQTSRGCTFPGIFVEDYGPEGGREGGGVHLR